MNEVITLTNFSQTWLGSYPGSVEESNLKSLCLYNDKIILSLPYNMYQSYIKGLNEEYRISQKYLKDTFLPIEEVYNKKDLIQILFNTNLDTIKLLGQTADREATNKFLESFAEKEGLSLDEFFKKYSNKKDYMYEYSKEAHYQKLAIITSLIIYNIINEISPCSLTVFTSAENYVFDSYQKYNSEIEANKISYDSLVSEINCLLPSVSELSWGEIFDLRKDKRIKSFRLWINSNKNEILNRGIEAKMCEELWKAFKELKPNILTNTIKATLGNFPLPIPINPAGVISSIYDIKKNLKFQREYDWLLFIYNTKDIKI